MKQRALPLAFLRATLISYVVTTLLLLLLAYLLYALRLNTKQMSVAVYAIYLLSCLLGGYFLGKTVSRRKLFWGMAQGILYLAILFVISFLFQRTISAEPLQALLVLAICSISGGIGSVLS